MIRYTYKCGNNHEFYMSIFAPAPTRCPLCSNTLLSKHVEEKPKEKPIEERIFKNYEGFNMDLIYPGQMMYIDMYSPGDILNEYRLGTRQGHIRDKVIVRDASPVSFTFQTVKDMDRGMMTMVDYADVKIGAIEIRELRELK